MMSEGQSLGRVRTGGNTLVHLVAVVASGGTVFHACRCATQEQALARLLPFLPAGAAILVTSSVHKAEGAPDDMVLFDLVRGRAEPWLAADGSYRCGESAARRLLLNVLENQAAPVDRYIVRSRPAATTARRRPENERRATEAVARSFAREAHLAAIRAASAALHRHRSLWGGAEAR
jgi:hypothetical protein